MAATRTETCSVARAFKVRVLMAYPPVCGIMPAIEARSKSINSLRPLANSDACALDFASAADHLDPTGNSRQDWPSAKKAGSFKALAGQSDVHPEPTVSGLRDVVVLYSVYRM